jgi:hypothetical protein
VFVNVGMPDVGDHFELRRPQRVFFGKDEVALEEAAFEQSVRGTDDEHLKKDKVVKADLSLFNTINLFLCTILTEVVWW